ncbi:MAG: hypothetical protein FJY91_01130 [Candidatus Harrisonbacteria bacterium]|nr:hypothetical protein [Candidatus Harrisonbacteria bacterium]
MHEHLNFRSITTKEVFKILFDVNSEAFEANFFAFIGEHFSERIKEELFRRYDHYQRGGRNDIFDDNFWNSYLSGLNLMPESKAHLGEELAELLTSFRAAIALC